MHLYIMRHGIAVEACDWSGSDNTRPLTREGEERTREIVEVLAKSGDLAADALWSSPLTRALQTAEIVGSVLKLKPHLIPALACGADLETVLKAVGKTPLPERLIWTGHEPDCGRIVGELVGNHNADYSFKRAGVALLTGTFAFGGMKLVWLRQPKDVLKD